MRYIPILALTGLIFSCGQREAIDYVDEYDRLDLANTVDTTKGTYNPRVDTTYIFPADSNDIVTVTEYSDYEIKSTIFPVRNKYLIAFSSSVEDSKIIFRDYKLQVDITDHEGLHIKRVVTKYDFLDSILTNPKYYFIREVKFKGIENDELRFDIKVSFMDSDEPAKMIKYYVHLVDGLRFENYPKTYYDSLNPYADEF